MRCVPGSDRAIRPARCATPLSPPPPACGSAAPQGVGVQEVLRALADAMRANDKAGRAQLMGLLLRLFFFEELPPEAMVQLVPLFQVGVVGWVNRVPVLR